MSIVFCHLVQTLLLLYMNFFCVPSKTAVSLWCTPSHSPLLPSYQRWSKASFKQKHCSYSVHLTLPSSLSQPTGAQEPCLSYNTARVLSSLLLLLCSVIRSSNHRSSIASMKLKYGTCSAQFTQGWKLISRLKPNPLHRCHLSIRFLASKHELTFLGNLLRAATHFRHMSMKRVACSL